MTDNKQDNSRTDLIEFLVLAHEYSQKNKDWLKAKEEIIKNIMENMRTHNQISGDVEKLIRLIQTQLSFAPKLGKFDISHSNDYYYKITSNLIKLFSDMFKIIFEQRKILNKDIDLSHKIKEFDSYFKKEKDCLERYQKIRDQLKSKESCLVPSDSDVIIHKLNHFSISNHILLLMLVFIGLAVSGIVFPNFRSILFEHLHDWWWLIIGFVLLYVVVVLIKLRKI